VAGLQTMITKQPTSDGLPLNKASYPGSTAWQVHASTRGTAKYIVIRLGEQQVNLNH
jgi:hypothetical protein